MDHVANVVCALMFIYFIACIELSQMSAAAFCGFQHIHDLTHVLPDTGLHSIIFNHNALVRLISQCNLRNQSAEDTF